MHLLTQQKEEIIRMLQQHAAPLKAVYVFGSYADGNATNDSDIDLAYLTDATLTSLQNWELSNRLALSLGQDIDLVDLAQMNTIFRYQIISTAKRIYGEGYDIEAFETLAYSFYLHFQEERKPILDAIYADKRVHNHG